MERDEPFALEALGDVAVGDASGEPLDDGGLADPGFPDQDGVVLGASTEDLDDPSDLVVAPDHRIDAPLGGAGGEVLAVLVEGGELVLGVLVGDPVRTAHLPQGAEHLLAGDVEAVGEGEQQVLDGEVVVPEFLAGPVGGVDGLGELAVHAGLVATLGAGQPVDGLLGSLPDHGGRLAEFGEQGGDDGALLGGDRHEDVVGGQFGVGEGAGLIDGRGEGLLCLDRPGLGVDCHEVRLSTYPKVDTQ